MAPSSNVFSTVRESKATRHAVRGRPDGAASERLAARELGSELEQEVRDSLRKSRLLQERAPADTVRVATDGRAVVDIAREVIAASGRLPGE